MIDGISSPVLPGVDSPAKDESFLLVCCCERPRIGLLGRSSFSGFIRPGRIFLFCIKVLWYRCASMAQLSSELLGEGYAFLFWTEVLG